MSLNLSGVIETATKLLSPIISKVSGWSKKRKVISAGIALLVVIFLIGGNGSGEQSTANVDAPVAKERQQAEVKSTQQQKPVSTNKSSGQKTHTNSIKMEFVLIPAGKFTTAKTNDFGEIAGVTVTISKPFYLGKYEVTQEQWHSVMGDNPSHFKGRTNPVENVSWNDAQEFIYRLNQKEGHDRYRLPTEAEWQHASNAGSKSITYFFSEGKNTITEADLAEYAWFSKNSGRTTHPVGQKKPNPWGLYDIYGNVWEWVQDGASKEYYGNTAAASTDPFVSSGASRVDRGGGWDGDAGSCSSVRRDYGEPVNRYNFLGFRLAFSPE